MVNGGDYNTIMNISKKDQERNPALVPKLQKKKKETALVSKLLQFPPTNNKQVYPCGNTPFVNVEENTKHYPRIVC